MKKLVYHDNERLLAWACERIGIGKFRSDAQAIGLESDGRIVGVAICDTFSSHDCSMHIASDGSKHWVTREFLVHAFSYPFIKCGYRRVTAPVAESNQDAVRFNLKLGFEVEGRHPLAAKDGAMLTMGLMRNRCPFLPKEYRT